MKGKSLKTIGPTSNSLTAKIKSALDMQRRNLNDYYRESLEQARETGTSSLTSSADREQLGRLLKS